MFPLTQDIGVLAVGYLLAVVAGVVCGLVFFVVVAWARRPRK